LAANWTFKLDDTAHEDVIYAIREYAKIGVIVYFIEQPPVQHVNMLAQLYQNLQKLGELSEASLGVRSKKIAVFLHFAEDAYA
jgi:hypothetical protein